MQRYLLILLFLVPLFQSCSDKFDISQFEDNSKSVNIGGDTLYIPLSPSWGGFNNPQAILVGREPFIYVCDTDNDRIVMLNLAGHVLGSLNIKKPIAIAQDYRLNLIVCAEFDTTLGTFSAVYKIDLYSAGNQIANAPVTRIIPQGSDFNFRQRRYTAVTAFYNNLYFVARTGPNNTSVFDPDNSILAFAPIKLRGGGERDSAIGRVPFIDPLSQGLITANGINSMTAFNKQNIDFIATLSGESSFKAQWFHYFVSGIQEKYISQFDPQRNPVEFVRPGRFLSPTSSCIDPAGNIFIADAGKDSIFKFNSSGDELLAFGGSKVFEKVYGVAFFDKTLYTLDAGTGQIIRFKLSTELQ